MRQNKGGGVGGWVLLIVCVLALTVAILGVGSFIGHMSRPVDTTKDDGLN